MKLRNLTAEKSVLSTLLALTLVFTPALAFAKDKGEGNGNKGNGKQVSAQVQVQNKDKENKNDDGDNENSGNKAQNSCWRAFGHLIAPGWIKHNGQVDILGECSLPFGIGKKFKGGNATTTVDTTAPVISNINSVTNRNRAVITWKTDEKADSTVFYSSTTPVNISSSNSVTKNNSTRDHSIVVNGLTASTTYYAVVRSKDALGNTATSSEFSFMTKGARPDTQIPAIFNVVSVVATSTIQVGWKTNENATSRVYYSTNPSVDVTSSTTAFVDNATLTMNHLMMISGLTPSTTYYLVIESKDASNNLSRTGVFSLATAAFSPSDVTPPVISLLTTTAGTSTIAVNWLTNEPATSKVFYATTSPVNVNSTTTAFVVNLSLVTSHSLVISGLATGTSMFLVAQSADASANVTTSSEVSTTTLSGL